MKLVWIYCRGTRTVAEYRGGHWRCASCGKHVQVIPPADAAQEAAA